MGKNRHLVGGLPRVGEDRKELPERRPPRGSRLFQERQGTLVVMVTMTIGHREHTKIGGLFTESTDSFGAVLVCLIVMGVSIYRK